MDKYIFHESNGLWYELTVLYVLLWKICSVNVRIILDICV